VLLHKHSTLNAKQYVKVSCRYLDQVCGGNELQKPTQNVGRLYVSKLDERNCEWLVCIPLVSLLQCIGWSSSLK